MCVHACVCVCVCVCVVCVCMCVHACMCVYVCVCVLSVVIQYILILTWQGFLITADEHGVQTLCQATPLFQQFVVM